MEKSIPMAIVAIVLSVVAVVSGIAGVFIAPAIGAGGVGTNQIADNSVTSTKIADETITDTDISDGSITMSDLSSAVVDVITELENIADNSITSEKIQDETIVDDDISAGAAIGPSKISGTAWTSTNDGSGSGLDADNLDGLNSNQFLRSDTGGTVEGNLAVVGSFLVVDGTIETTENLFAENVVTENVVYSTPHTHYFVVGGDAFHPRGSGVAYTNGGGSGAYIHTGSNGTLSASVHLPHGAVVTAFSVYFNDTSASDLWVYLGRYALTNGGYTTMASVVSQDVSGYGSKSTTSISESTINNTAYSYTVYASWGGDNNLSIMGALITYTTDAAL